MEANDKMELLRKLIEALPQGKAVVSWQDKTVVKIERVETQATITR